MAIAEKEIVEKIRALPPEKRGEVLRYVDRLLDESERKPSLGEKLKSLMSDVPPDVWDKLPRDGAEQHDYYIYGTAKRKPAEDE